MEELLNVFENLPDYKEGNLCSQVICCSTIFIASLCAKPTA